MAEWKHFQNWLAREAEAVVRGQAAIDPTKFRLALLDGLTVVDTSNPGQLASFELLQQFGYRRGDYAYAPGAGSWNAVKSRYEFPVQTINVSIAGASVQWSAAVLWSDSDNDCSIQVNSLDAAANRLTITAHGRSSGDKVAVTSSGTLATGIPANTVLYLGVVDANTVELYSDAARTVIVDFSDVGTGTHYLRLCNGTPVFFANFPPQQIGDQATQPIDISWAFINCGNINGV